MTFPPLLPSSLATSLPPSPPKTELDTHIVGHPSITLPLPDRASQLPRLLGVSATSRDGAAVRPAGSEGRRREEGEGGEEEGGGQHRGLLQEGGVGGGRVGKEKERG